MPLRPIQTTPLKIPISTKESPVLISHSIKELCHKSTTDFLKEHQRYAREKLRSVPHIIVYLNGRLTLLQQINGEALDYEIIKTMDTPAKENTYQIIKTISHGAVSLNMMVGDIHEEELIPEVLAAKMAGLRETFSHLKQSYYQDIGTLLPAVDLTLKYIEELSGCSHPKQLNRVYEAYSAEMKPYHEMMGAMATKLQLGGLHRILLKWLTEIDLSSTYIVIVGPRGPRQGLIEYQYFSELRKARGLQINTASGGLIYSEMFPTHMQAITMEQLIDDLAADLLNQDIGEQMLENRDAMNADVLAKHAKPVIETLMNSVQEAKNRWHAWFWQPPAAQSKPRCPFASIFGKEQLAVTAAIKP